MIMTLQLPSLRALFKYVPARFNFLIFVYLLLCGIAYIFFLQYISNKKQRYTFLANRFLFIGLFLFVVSVNFFIYPVADGLKAQGRGSDQDDALIVTTGKLLAGKAPYEGRTYYKSNPISPGPGWIILNIPFSHKNLYFLLTPFYLLVLALLIKKITGSYFFANLLVVLCMSSVGFWETMVVGSDLFAAGAVFVFCLYLFQRYLPGPGIPAVLGIFLLGFAATSRIIFLYCCGIIAVFCWKSKGTRALFYPFISIIIAVLLHSAFYSWSRGVYTPLHLLGKGSMLLPSAFKYIALICVGASLFLSLRNVKNELGSWLFYFWLCLIIPMFFVSMGDLIVLRKYNFGLWEGANYLLVALPVYLAYFCTSLYSHGKT